MKIVVIGETCVDKFVYSSINRLSPEAPVPILNPTQITENPGMAGNVVANIKALQPDSIISLITQLEHITKTRYVDIKTNHMFIRVDEGEEYISDLQWTPKMDVLLAEADIVIVSDYDKGYLTDIDLRKIAAHSKLSILDSKRKLTDRVINSFNFVKLNEEEWENNKGLDDKNIIVNGITSHGLGSYNLDLQTLDSVQMTYYKYNLAYDSASDIIKAIFYRYSTAGINNGIDWIKGNEFSKSTMFKPIIYTKDKFEMPLNITNTLTNTPYNVDELIKHAITNESFLNATWSPVTPFVPIRSKHSFTTLSNLGAGSLIEILQVTSEHPFKVLTSKRRPILDVRSSDGSRVFQINHDGKVVSHNLSTYKIELLEKKEYETNIPNNLNSGLWYEHNIRGESEY